MQRFLTVSVLIVGVMIQTTLAAARDDQWKSVREAIDQGLPKTAVEKLQPIIDQTLAAKAYPEAIKAIALKIALEGNIEGNKPEEKIFRLETELANAPVPMQPVMEAVLAHWYRQYFQQNRWRFMQRTQTAAAPGDDIQTWDLPRILAEIDEHFTAALADPVALQKIPIAEYGDLLDKGSMPDRYRPTLYDFLAHEALQFYSAGEQGALLAEDTFLVAVDSPIFDDVGAFLKWEPTTTDARSPKLKAIRLYQQLLAFHANDQDRDAFADADLGRLNFGNNQAVGEDKSDRYQAALQRFAKEWADHEISARALAHWAGEKKTAEELVEARKLAQRGLDLYPNSVGGAMCFNIIREIEAKSASITTERVWNDPLPKIEVTYRNVTEVYFRAVPYDFEDLVKSQRWHWNQIDDKRRQELLNRKPAFAWDAKLPPTEDYRQRVQELPCPPDLKPGFYYIVASHDRSFSEKENQVSVAPVWVSDLALVIRQRNYESTLEGFVLDARSGVPLEDATVQQWRRDREGWFKPAERTATDANGLFSFKGDDRRTGILVVHRGDQAVSTFDETWVGRGSPESDTMRTVFFTDRALYRPGQTIYYKGICLRTDQPRSSYTTLNRQRVSVVFNDPNGKEIARADHVTNEYGSFSGVFTAPRDRVMGRMQLMARGPHGSTAFNVEEYKRPKFQVAIEKPLEAPRLDAEVTMSGTATAYTGAPIGGATVKWRVERKVRFPVWCWWARWYWPNANQGQAIAHGTALTDQEGKFTVTFVAKPDPTMSAEEEPVFEFQVHADVTDTTGETRSADQVTRAGFTALQATVIAAEWQTPAAPVAFSINTSSLDSEPQAAKGTLRVFTLKQPDTVQRKSLGGSGFQPRFWPVGVRNPSHIPVEPANPNSWENGERVAETPFATDASGQVTVEVGLKAGIYRAELRTADRFGKEVTAKTVFQVLDPQAKRYRVNLPNHFAAPRWSVEPGEPFLAVWGTGYEKGRAFVELEHRGKLLRQYWTDAERTQELIEQGVDEEMRGGFTLRVTYVRENRAYLNERVVDVPWSNKQLTVKWERFTSKLMPGQNETWTAVVSGPKAERAASEMVAGLYDASLDQYLPHDWLHGFNGFRREVNWVQARFENSQLGFQHIQGYWQTPSRGVNLTYRHFPAELVANLWGYHALRRFGGSARELQNGTMVMEMSAPAPLAATEAGGLAMDGVAAKATSAEHKAGFGDGTGGGAAPPAPDLSKVAARQNLNETAFFFPHLTTDDQGVVRIEFTMPEALTEWKFLGFAHDADLRSGYLTDTTVTAKDLMVEPNPPRFVREGDVIEFTVKVTNQTEQPQTGRVRLTLANARTLEAMDAALGNTQPEIEFEVPAKQARTYAWRLTIPDGCEFLTYKAVGASATSSDGEEGFLPVLSRRILVTESLPLPIRGKQTKQFEFTKLLKSGQSDTLQHQSLTVQMVSQPAWYAVMALPYLMEYPYECSEQIFNRLYANALARHIANSDPKIKRIFEQWRGTPALDSPLTKNQDLKAVMLEETPWYRQAMDESQARRNVGILFEDNRLNEETARTLRKLAEMQLSEGMWPWFPGGRPSEYISLYITTGFGRLRHLGVDLEVAPALRSLAALDNWIDEQYRWILKHGNKDANNLNYTIAFYLYGRSFFLKDHPIENNAREAVDYFLGQAKQYWLQLDSRQSQAHLAVGLKRFGDAETAMAILKSIKERSVSNEEMGMFWRDLELSWWWFRAPIETQAMMIEAFAEVTGDLQAVEDCQVWLLKQKQTQDWKTTKATADAIYALLLRGANKLASDALVEIALAGEWIKPENVEAGTGFYEERFTRSEIKPAMGRITVKKTDDGVSWGSVHWQYLEDMSKVTPHEGTPLKLTKTLWIKENTKAGPVIKPVEDALEVGDELVVRVTLRTDRDMEYVHLKDQRGSGAEPVNVLSRQKFQDGLAYYESTRDTASHFFIEYLPKGVYVFEYSVRIQHRGRYQTGLASIQCMYAPEFNSHSESFTLEVK